MGTYSEVVLLMKQESKVSVCFSEINVSGAPRGGGGGGGHYGKEGGRTRVTYFAEEGVFF